MIKILQPTTADHVYANGAYLFYSSNVKDEVYFAGEVERTIYVISGSFTIASDKLKVEAGDTIDVKNREVLLIGNGQIYVAQVASHDAPLNYLTITRAGVHYKVVKPWGYELWLTKDNDRYCAKKIFIKAGNQTSLQYHNFKEETNLIESGNVTLVFKANREAQNDAVTKADLGESSFNGPVCLHVTPNTIHRLRANTDLHLFEVSTPHLDDVIRVQDDANRGNGRIESEHK